MKCSILGSFRKYYRQVCEAYDVFERNGISVLSPRKSRIINPEAEFVVLESDPKGALPAEIELRVLREVLRSDFVYIVDPRGYVGRTTALEMGYAGSGGIEIYSSRPVRDDFLRMHVKGVYSPQDMCEFLRHRRSRTIAQ